MCSVHGNHLEPNTCNSCNGVKKMLKPAVLAELTKGSTEVPEGEVPSAAKRFSRSDETPPSLILSDSAMELAAKVFSLGKFKLPKHFDELTKEYLFLPTGQNDILTSNINLENLFRKYEHDADFSAIFTFKNQVLKCLRDLRVVQRIPFLVQDEVDRALEGSRSAAKKVGFVFCPEPPEVSVLGPKPHPNHLAYRSRPSFSKGSSLSMPSVIGITNGCKNLTQVSYIFRYIFKSTKFFCRKTLISSLRTSWSSSSSSTPSRRS